MNIQKLHTQKVSSVSIGNPAWLTEIETLSELEIRFETDTGILWQYMRHKRKPAITRQLIADCELVMDAVEQSHRSATGGPKVNYLVGASARAGVFSMGGDLSLFRQLIDSRDSEGLRRYAYACVDGQLRRAGRMGLPICTIALVQGNALGGGFEAALSHDVIIAEKQAKFGLPEILFNLFPGMGAYSFLSRKLTRAHAERLMMSHTLYSAEEMFEIGVVDAIAEDGEGEDAVRRFVDRHMREKVARLSIARLRSAVMPVTRQEMTDVADIWVDAAMSLSARDLAKMDHLVAAQERMSKRMAEVS